MAANPAARHRRWPVIACCAALAFCVCPPAATRADTLQEKAAALVREYERSSKAIVGVSAVDLASRRMIIGIRAETPRIPASNQKLLTGAFILARYGGGYEFKTACYRRGDDLVVVGAYDPALGDPKLAEEDGDGVYADLDAWAKAAKRAFGDRIAGDLVLSPPANLESYRHPDWPTNQHHRAYAAPVAALNFHNNCIDVSFGADPARTRPKLVPGVEGIRVVNRVKIGKQNLWSLRLSEGDAVATLRGTVTAKGTWPLSVPVNDPPMLLGRVFADRLAKADVALGGALRVMGPIPASAAMTPLAESRTSLADVMRRALKRSLNMAAECMLLRAGDGTWGGSAAVLEGSLARTFEVAAGQMSAADGSGLSRRNRASPAAIVKVLVGVAAREDRDVLLDALPVSGVDGTLARRMTKANYRRRVRAKTGYILGVCCLSGYVVDGSGVPKVAFSVMANEVPAGKAWVAKKLQDAICRAIVDSLE